MLDVPWIILTALHASYFNIFAHILHRPILMKTIFILQQLKHQLNVLELHRAYSLLTPHFLGIVEISAQVHSFLNRGISYLVD